MLTVGHQATSRSLYGDQRYAVVPVRRAVADGRGRAVPTRAPHPGWKPLSEATYDGFQSPAAGPASGRVSPEPMTPSTPSARGSRCAPRASVLSRLESARRTASGTLRGSRESSIVTGRAGFASREDGPLTGASGGADRINYLRLVKRKNKGNRGGLVTNQLIGTRIKALRQEQELSQDESRLFGFKDRQTVSAIETGIRRVTASELLLAVERFGVPLDYFTDPFRLDGECLFSWRQTGVEPTG